jgi:hypothetical protein
MEYNIILGAVVFLLAILVAVLYVKISDYQKQRKIIDSHLENRIRNLRDEMRFRFENPPKYKVGQVVVYDNIEYTVESCVLRVVDVYEIHWLYILRGQNDKTIEIRE